MNLAIHSIEANLGPAPADTFFRDLHKDPSLVATLS